MAGLPNMMLDAASSKGGSSFSDRSPGTDPAPVRTDLNAVEFLNRRDSIFLYIFLQSRVLSTGSAVALCSMVKAILGRRLFLRRVSKQSRSWEIPC